MVEYAVMVEATLPKAANDVESRINRTLRDFGMREQIAIRSRFEFATVSMNDHQSDEQLAETADSIREALLAEWPDSNPVVTLEPIRDEEMP